MLIGLPARVLLARDPVDFRKSIDGLAAQCDLVLREEPLDGTLFLFVNRRRNAVKVRCPPVRKTLVVAEFGRVATGVG